MLVRRLQRNQQNQHLADEPVIRRAERYWKPRAQECGDWAREAPRAGVRDGNSKAQCGGTDLFALEQACTDVRLEQSMPSGKKACGFFERALFRRSVHVEDNIRWS